MAIGNPTEGDSPSRAEFTLWQGIIVGILLVVTITVVTLVIQSFTATQAAYQDLKDKVTEQNAKMDLIIIQLSKSQAPESPAFIKR